MKVTKQTAVAVLFTVISVIIYICEQSNILLSLLHNITFVSWLGIIVLVYIVISWRRAYYRMLSPYFIFIIMLYMVVCGQTLCWAFGIRAGYRDLQYAAYNGLRFTTEGLCRALLYSYPCLLTVHTTVLSRIDAKTHQTTKKHDNISTYADDFALYQTMTIIGVLLVVISCYPFVLQSITGYTAIKAGRYGSQFVNLSHGISSWRDKLAEFFPTGILVLLFAWGKKNENNSKNYLIKAILLYFLMGIYCSFELIQSQRTGVVLFALAFILVYYYNKTINKKTVIIGLFIIILGMAGLRFVDMFRSNSVKNLSDFITYTANPENNPVIDFIGDTGWNLMTTYEFQSIIPDTRNFGFGSSYIISLLSVVPNIGFWSVHPAQTYGDISSWLGSFLGFSFGIGGSPVAEAYYNFGSFGFLIFIAWGLFFSKINRMYENKNNYLLNCHAVLFVGILMKSIVRSTFFAVFRPYVYYILLPMFIIRYLHQIIKKVYIRRK